MSVPFTQPVVPWVSTSEALPAIGERVLVFAYGHVYTGHRRKGRGEGWSWTLAFGPTLVPQAVIRYWSPMPFPPKEQP